MFSCFRNQLKKLKIGKTVLTCLCYSWELNKTGSTIFTKKSLEKKCISICFYGENEVLFLQSILCHLIFYAQLYSRKAWQGQIFIKLCQNNFSSTEKKWENYYKGYFLKKNKNLRAIIKYLKSIDSYSFF